MGQKIAGTCYIKADGAQLSVEGSVEFPLNSVTRETKIGSTGVVGYSEVDAAPYIKASVFLQPDFPTSMLDSTDMTITAELANGWVYTLNGAWLEGDIAGNASDGTTSLEFHGLSGTLQTS